MEYIGEDEFDGFEDGVEKKSIQKSTYSVKLCFKLLEELLRIFVILIRFSKKPTVKR